MARKSLASDETIAQLRVALCVTCPTCGALAQSLCVVPEPGAPYGATVTTRAIHYARWRRIHIAFASLVFMPD